MEKIAIFVEGSRKRRYFRQKIVKMSPSKNLEIDAIFIKGLRKKRNFRRMIEEKSVISVKRWRKRLDFHQKRYFFQKIPKRCYFSQRIVKMTLFPLNDLVKELILVKGLQKKKL